MSDFKVGDKVRLINQSGWVKAEKGSIYEISLYIERGKVWIGSVELYPEDFELVEDKEESVVWDGGGSITR